MTIGALRRNRIIASQAVLAAIMLQTAAGVASGACPGMAGLSESAVHARQIGEPHDTFARLGESVPHEGTDAESCECPSTEPTETDRDPTENCTMAVHCVSSPAVVPVAELLTEPATKKQTQPYPKRSSHPVALSHPTPPPRA